MQFTLRNELKYNNDFSIYYKYMHWKRINVDMQM